MIFSILTQSQYTLPRKENYFGIIYTRLFSLYFFTNVVHMQWFPSKYTKPTLALQHLRGLVFFTESARCLVVEPVVRSVLPADAAASLLDSSLKELGFSSLDRGGFVGVSSSSIVSSSRRWPLNAIENKITTYMLSFVVN